MKILVSGASIAGPAVAYWLQRYGFDVTVVERGAQLRGGGYPIDIRGVAVEVVRRMGIHEELRRAHIDTRAFTFVEPDGRPIATLRPHLPADDEARSGDLEVPRGDLARVLYDATKERVTYRFSDSIVGLDDRSDGVDVRFRSGSMQRFDLVIAADGVHSSTRAIRFGPEEPLHRYLGYCFAGFTLRNDFGLSHEAVIWSEIGRAAALYAVGDRRELHGFLNLSLAVPPFGAFRDPQAQRDLVARAFAHDGWYVPQMVEAMQSAGDLFFDMVTQIRMPGWSAGRLALVGDAAFAPSFLTGQGSSTALVGAYLLAGELATTGDYATAFDRYEKLARPFVEANQDLVTVGDATMFPSTPEALERRNRILRQLPALPSDNEPAHWAIDLPDYTG